MMLRVFIHGGDSRPMETAARTLEAHDCIPLLLHPDLPVDPARRRKVAELFVGECDVMLRCPGVSPESDELARRCHGLDRPVYYAAATLISREGLRRG